MSLPPERAVFLSYASQDAAAARRICEALRTIGVEVWFDQNELTGGDAWDAKIRKQIKDCALFVPIISANTQARTEGYFRLEWRLADQRTHLMAKGRAFLLPVVIDATHDADAHVPDSFTEVQWTRLPGGESTAAFCECVQKLLAGEVAPASHRHSDDAGASRDGARGRGRATPLPPPSRRWLVPAILGTAGIAALMLWQPWRQPEKSVSTPASVASTPTPASASSTEIARIRASFVPDRWQKGDFEALSPTLDRLIQANPEDADAWALRSVINSLQVMRNFDSGNKPLEAGKTAAERALRLAPESPLAELALGMHLVAMISRGSDSQAGRQHVAHAVAALQPDALTRYADLVSAWLGYNIEGTEQSAKAWLAAEPGATFPAWILAQLNVTQRRAAEAEKWAEAAAADRNITGTRAFYTLFESKFYLRADLAAAKAALARIPSSGQAIHRVIHGRWVLAMAEQHWDAALQQLAQVPEPMLYDRTYHGPRALLAGLAHQRAGRADAALVQFREAERLLRSELASDADNEELHLVLAVTLACAGRAAEARSELALVEPLVKGQAASVYWGALALSIAQTYGVLGDFGHMAEWVRKLFVEPSGFPFTPASFRLDPRFAGTLDAPEIQALLKEFAALDQPPASAATSGTALDQKSVAVLAFANLSDDKANEYFSDGISEELLNVLGRVPGLRVAAPMSAFSFKGKNVSAQEIGQKLNVAYLVNGSVRRAGPAIRVVARLSRAETDEQIWTEKFDGEAKNVFALQDEIAGKIAAALSLKLGAAARTARPIDPGAHRLYLEGRQFWSARSLDALDRAEASFQRALLIESESALIHAGLAELYGTRALYRALAALPEAGDLSRATEQADRAVALDPKLAQGYVARATIAMTRKNYTEAEGLLRDSLALAPNDALALNRLGDVMISAGRLDAGLEYYQRALQLDPLSLFMVRDVVREATYAHRFQEAIEVQQRFEAAAPQDTRFAVGDFHAQMQLGMVEQAKANLKAHLPTFTPESFPGPGIVEWVFQLREAKLEAESAALAKQLLSHYGPDTYIHAMVLMARGQTEEALPLLKPFPPGSQDRLYWSPIFDPVREDPRFLRKIEELGVAAEYKVARETLARMLQDPAAKN